MNTVLEPAQTAKASGPSAIFALHASYEAAAAAHHAIDDADVGGPPSAARLRFSVAMTAADAEQDALRTAILYQVPQTPAEAVVLQYHVSLLAGLYGDNPMPQHERAAFLLGCDAVFAFLMREATSRGEGFGPRVMAAAKLVGEQTRLRSGQVEG